MNACWAEGRKKSNYCSFRLFSSSSSRSSLVCLTFFILYFKIDLCQIDVRLGRENKFFGCSWQHWWEELAAMLIEWRKALQLQLHKCIIASTRRERERYHKQKSISIVCDGMALIATWLHPTCLHSTQKDDMSVWLTRSHVKVIKCDSKLFSDRLSWTLCRQWVAAKPRKLSQQIRKMTQTCRKAVRGGDRRCEICSNPYFPFIKSTNWQWQNENAVDRVDGFFPIVQLKSLLTQFLSLFHLHFCHFSLITTRRVQLTWQLCRLTII